MQTVLLKIHLFLTNFIIFHRSSRNASEKKRRDKLNIYISELAAMVPSCTSAQRKLDKTTVLKMTVNYMKVNNGMFISLLLPFFACCSQHFFWDFCGLNLQNFWLQHYCAISFYFSSCCSKMIKVAQVLFNSVKTNIIKWVTLCFGGCDAFFISTHVTFSQPAQQAFGRSGRKRERAHEGDTRGVRERLHGRPPKIVSTHIL